MTKQTEHCNFTVDNQMFTFINSYILYFLAAAIIPLVIYLFNRQRSKKIYFSSIRFLKLLEQKRLKNIKIYQVLLLIVRTCILLLLILSFSRPTYKGKVNIIGSNTRTTSVIIIDNGINMLSFDSKGNRFIRAKEQSIKLSGQLGTNNQLFIFTTGQYRNVITNPGEIDHLKECYSRGEWDHVFFKARELYNEYVNYNKELFIISDFQFNNRQFKEKLADFKDVQIYLIKIGHQPTMNVKIDTVIMKSHLLEKNKNINMEVEIENLSPKNEAEIDVDLFVNDQRVNHKKITLDPAGRLTADLNFQSKLYGIHKGYVEISDDDLLADNRYYFNFTIPEKIEVLFIDDHPSSFLNNALQTISENTNVSIKTATYKSWAKYNLNQFHVIFLSNINTLQPSLVNGLIEFLNQKGSMIICPGMQTIPTDFNNAFKKINPEIKLLELKQSENKNNYYTFKKLNYNHPLFAGLYRTSTPEIAEPVFYRYFSIYPSQNGESIISFNNNHPFLFRYDTHSGSVYLLTSYFDEQWNDLPLKGIFSPLLLRLFYLGASTAAQLNRPVQIGEEYIFIYNQILNKNEYVLETPGGEMNRIVPEPYEHSLIFKLNQFNIPGQYLLYADRENFTVISANISSHSIQLPYLDLDQLKTEIPYLTIFSENQYSAEDIYEARMGKELWKIFILIAIIFLFIEIILVKKVEGKI